MPEDQTEITVQAGSFSISGYIYKHLFAVAVALTLDNATEKGLTQND